MKRKTPSLSLNSTFSCMSVYVFWYRLSPTYSALKKCRYAIKRRSRRGNKQDKISLGVVSCDFTVYVANRAALFQYSPTWAFKTFRVIRIVGKTRCFESNKGQKASEKWKILCSVFCSLFSISELFHIYVSCVISFFSFFL